MLRHLLDSLSRPQVVIRGSNPDWLRALGPGAAVWRRLGPYSVVHATKLGVPPTWRKRFVIPLFEHHTRTMPRPCWALIPSPEAIHVFKEKDGFLDYAKAQGLADYLPEHYEIAAPRFPAVLKRTNLNAGDGIVVVESAEELARRLGEKPWADNPVLLQEVILGEAEEVAHLVCVGGRIRWWAAFAYPLESPREIRKVSQTSEMVRVGLGAEDIAVFERFLLPVGFDGPAAVNYKRRADGRVAIFEFNARFGGSLMRPQHIDDLEAALRVVLAEAKWQEAAR
ncbi:MAG TPA: hypothetical protein VG757_15040 [Devosia sp.]|nr:hypothetical protein [Devosia sp.]